MALWIPITILAAFLQNLRSSAQKHLKNAMGTTGATFVRFGFGLPFALFFLSILIFTGDRTLPVPGQTFYFAATLGALMQILGTFLLVYLFSFRNFAVGTAYSRTEPAQAALFGLVFLAEAISPGALIAIAISVIGVMLISVAHLQMSARNLVASVFAPTALIGIGSGTAFGVSAVSYRAASLSLGGPDFMTQAAMTLVAALLVQVVSMGLWMLLRARGEFARIARAWKVSLLAGAAGATASFCWFMAMTLQNAAVVKALGQVEMLFTFATTVFIFREKINGREISGCLLISLGILVLLFIG